MINTEAIVAKPTLTGERVELVPLGPRHADATYQSLQDAEVLRLTGTHAVFTRAQIERWCATRAEQTDRIDLVVEDRQTGEYLGELSLNEIDGDNESAGFRIALNSEHLGRGLGPEATRLILKYAFDAIGLHRVRLEVFSFNERAIRSYEKCGFVREGRMRDALLWDGERYDTLIMGMLRDELR
ncbi:GNAT family N-acetyltransferase [Phytoactinopolyspora halotolerans]|uniref:GNAT family N-acetyltransferase n=1 Tax=Phytoactinopolyspora halotolerans TaxID=1981512 RepID=A0A6L9S467_9ACTN|nr:GNAT family protein [Phytoactinopolyspora halotolerans]NED98789.1 GNAT family N-acetyltransferase [Phytoactinopolyspora halotolerans]